MISMIWYCMSVMQTAVTVFDLLDYYESCERLNISYNKNLGIRGWQACARFIKKVRFMPFVFELANFLWSH